jgi:hypothetical protein
MDEEDYYLYVQPDWYGPQDDDDMLLEGSPNNPGNNAPAYRPQFFGVLQPVVPAVPPAQNFPGPEHPLLAAFREFSVAHPYDKNVPGVYYDDASIPVPEQHPNTNDINELNEWHFRRRRFVLKYLDTLRGFQPQQIPVVPPTAQALAKTPSTLHSLTLL